MHNTTHMGMNRTGAKMSPVDVSRMAEAALAAPETLPEGKSFAAIRGEAITEADRVGSVPLPGTVKGVLTTGMAKLKGEKPEVLIDKLGERLAFERTGVRLYEALITKCQLAADGAFVPPLEALREIREDEARHFLLLQTTLENLGADPTAQTPCADVSAVASMGLVQTLTDPRTTVAQCLNAILMAELADHASWELLISLAEQTGHDEMAETFRAALTQEEAHLGQVKTWLREAVAREAT
ncbi:MAG: ferritin-like domain-containing protein [Pseudomonadota bacterium]|uniref:Ferritin-like domain-containing protein n=1 Tax=Caldimonas aquatica TaxID=376175 RepID=A0ABY6MVE4_9BURK|nr:ferritin-like domain-containing protein [Schlegelella aquatica]UZD55969.1 ferritin-like domain-containing protein [Schlegelella aquatica]